MVSSLGLVISFFFPFYLSLIFNDIFGIKLRYTIKWGFPGGSDGKESACNMRDLGSIPGLGRSPGEEHGNPLQYSCLENPHGQRDTIKQ